MQLAPHEYQLLSAEPWFAALPDELRTDLLAAARRRELADGVSLHRRGDTVDGFYALLRGRVRVSGSSADGAEATLAYLEPGNWFGEIALLDDGPRTHDVHAHGAASLLVVPRPEFQRLLATHPQLGLHLARLLATKLRAAMHWIEDMTLRPLPVRLARRLLALHRRSSQNDGEISLSQDALAALVGTSRQSVNRELKDWQDRGWVRLGYGSVAVTDAHALHALAEPDAVQTSG